MQAWYGPYSRHLSYEAEASVEAYQRREGKGRVVYLWFQIGCCVSHSGGKIDGKALVIYLDVYYV